MNYKTPFTRPTYKGTYFFDIGKAGWTESVYAAPVNNGGNWTLPQGFLAAPAPTTVPAMLAAMRAVLPLRERLMQMYETGGKTPGKGLATDPVTCVALRCDDQQSLRGSTLIRTNIGQGVSFAGVGPAYLFDLTDVSDVQIYQDNDIEQSAFHVLLSDGNGHTASEYFHGVPIGSFLKVNQLNAGVVAPDAFDRDVSQISSAWTSALATWCNGLLQNGLGFRFNYPTWFPGGQGDGVYSPYGNGTPVAWYYDLPGTPKNTYTAYMGTNLQWSSQGQVLNQFLNQLTAAPPAVPVSLIGKFVVVSRENQQLKVINGRHPAVGMWLEAGTSPYVFPAGYYINVKKRCPNYLADNTGTYDTNGYLAPLAWSVVQPLPGGPPLVPAPAQPPGVQLLELTTHKIGRPFGQQRGRASNRVT